VSNVDPVVVKSKQRAAWNQVAAGWEKWWPTIEAASQPLSDRLCEMAHVSEGNWVLDFATGVGEPAITAAKRVGKSGKVTAVDQAPSMLQIAERRARAASLGNIGVHAADAETLATWPEKSYDAALCRWGLMFMPSLHGALRAIHNVLVTGGWLAAATWATPDRVPFCTTSGAVITNMLAIEPPPPGMPHAFALSDPEFLARSFAGAGFRDVQGERLVLTYEFQSAETYASFVRECAPIAIQVAAQPEEKQAEVWAAVAEAAKSFADSAGRVAIHGESLLIAGRR
jgi:ubiquinone/menaquinone biosynthesis C-methylase UbiE